MQVRQFTLAKEPDCAVCGSSPTIHEPIDYEAFCAAAAGQAAALVLEIDSRELKRRLDGNEDLLLLDVREPFEAELARIDGSRLIPLGELEGVLDSLDEWKDRSIVIHCHHGGRSRKACEILLARGFSKVANLSQGIDGWSRQVDTTIPRY